ncbi:glycosyltransferase [Burkholderia gladioli]
MSLVMNFRKECCNQIMRILQFTSYPTLDPRHGGQIRAAQMAKQLREAGHDVKSVAVYVSDDFPEAGRDDIPFSSESKFWNASLPWLSDYFSGIFCLKDDVAKSKISRLMRDFSPDIIFVEQPWLFAAVAQEAPRRTKLVYSSQNIEWRLKEKLFGRMPHGSSVELTDAIRRAELSAAKHADLVVACTQADLDYYRSECGAPTFEGVLAGNGVEPFSCTDVRVGEWREHFKHPVPVFVSSAHLPNAQGFWDMMSPGLTFLRPEEQVLILGGVSSIILQGPGFEKNSAVNLSRLNIAGPREKTELQAIIRSAHVILLPITDGEGSNLKTAEALEAGIPIVATSKAFRGFEAAMKLEHVTIADNPKDFRLAVRRALAQSRRTDLTPLAIRSRFYWESQLMELMVKVDSLR